MNLMLHVNPVVWQLRPEASVSATFQGRNVVSRLYFYELLSI